MLKRLCAFLLLFSTFPALAQRSTIDKDFLLGRFDYRRDADFEKVDKKHAARPLYLHAVVYQAFREMYDEAKKDGVELQILSGTRSFQEQKVIWERKWKGLDSLQPKQRIAAIMEFSSMPSASRHHWGTDIDLNFLENCYFEEGRGRFIYQWLVNNAARFGFHQVYTSQDDGRTGHKEEKWHWSYLPLASRFLSSYNREIDYCEITGFLGSEFAEEADMIPYYVNGIAQHLQGSLPVAILPKGIVLAGGAEDLFKEP